MSFALVLGGFAYKLAPTAPAGGGAAERRIPGRQRLGLTARRLAETMATSVATPLIKQFATIAGIDTISTTNSLGNLDRHPVRAQPQHRRGGGRRAGGDRAHAAAIAAGDDLAAELPQGQSGRCADPADGAGQRYVPLTISMPSPRT
jgi:hypothetical protein